MLTEGSDDEMVERGEGVDEDDDEDDEEEEEEEVEEDEEEEDLEQVQGDGKGEGDGKVTEKGKGKEKERMDVDTDVEEVGDVTDKGSPKNAKVRREFLHRLPVMCMEYSFPIPRRQDVREYSTYARNLKLPVNPPASV